MRLQDRQKKGTARRYASSLHIAFFVAVGGWQPRTRFSMPSYCNRRHHPSCNILVIRMQTESGGVAGPETLSFWWRSRINLLPLRWRWSRDREPPNVSRDVMLYRPPTFNLLWSLMTRGYILNQINEDPWNKRVYYSEREYMVSSQRPNANPILVRNLITVPDTYLSPFH